MRGIGDLKGAHKTRTSKLALETVATLQRKRDMQQSYSRRLQSLREHYGAQSVDDLLREAGGTDVDLNVLESVLAVDHAHCVEDEIERTLLREAGHVPVSTRWQSLLEFLPDVFREGLLVVLSQAYKNRCSRILSQEWSWNWVGWDSRHPDGSPNRDDGDGLYQVVEKYRQCEEGDLGEPVLLALHDVVRRHIQLAHLHSAVEHISDEQKEAALLRQGLKVGKGKVWGRNNCLPDSLLQLMQESGIIARCAERDRKEPCVAVRAALTSLPEDSPLRPRRLDAESGRVLGLDDGAFLQTHVHGEFILKFFLQYFEQRDMVLRQLPSTGVRINVLSRCDSDAIPVEFTDVCQAEIPNVDEERLDFKLFNRTGEGVSGYHYEPITVLSRESASSSSGRTPPANPQQSATGPVLRRSKRKSGA